MCAHFMVSSIIVVTTRFPKHSHKIGHNSQNFKVSVWKIYIKSPRVMYFPRTFTGIWSELPHPELGHKCRATKFTEALGIPQRVMISLSSDPATSDIFYISGSISFDTIKSVPAQ